MRREVGFDQITPDPRSVLTVGTFDGIHLGHQAILSYLKERAKQQNGVPTLVTFHPHPREVVRDEPVPLLTTIDERAALAEAVGIERLVVVPFSHEFAQTPAEAFVENILVEQIGLQEIVVGYDHRFGRQQKGTTETLRRLGQVHGYKVDVISAHQVGEETVSSSKIRTELREAGNVRKAAEMLGRLYRLNGKVVRGDGRGRKIGYPTANLVVDDSRKLIPSRGVYAVKVTRVDHPDHRLYGGMMNIGYRPTFSDKETLTPEVHLFDCSEVFYEETLQVDFVERIRDEISFESVDELVTQLGRDESRCKEVLEVLS